MNINIFSIIKNKTSKVDIIYWLDEVYLIGSRLAPFIKNLLINIKNDNAIYIENILRCTINNFFDTIIITKNTVNLLLNENIQLCIRKIYLLLLLMMSITTVLLKTKTNNNLGKSNIRNDLDIIRKNFNKYESIINDTILTQTIIPLNSNLFKNNSIEEKNVLIILIVKEFILNMEFNYNLLFENKNKINNFLNCKTLITIIFFSILAILINFGIFLKTL